MYLIHAIYLKLNINNNILPIILQIIINLLFIIYFNKNINV